MSDTQGRMSGTATPTKSPAPASTPQSVGMATHTMTSMSHPQMPNTVALSSQTVTQHTQPPQTSHPPMLASQAPVMTSQTQVMNATAQQPITPQQMSHPQQNMNIPLSTALQQPQHQQQQQQQQQQQAHASQPSAPHLMQMQQHVANMAAANQPQLLHENQGPPSHHSVPQASQHQGIHLPPQQTVQQTSQSSVQPTPQQQTLTQQQQQHLAGQTSINTSNAPHQDNAQQAQQQVSQQLGAAAGAGGAVSVMSVGQGLGQGGAGAGGMVRVSLPLNLQQMQSLQSMAGVQQLQQVQGMPHIQGVQHVQGVSQVQPQLHQMQGLQQVQGVQGLHQLQGAAQGFHGLPPGMQLVQNSPLFTQQPVLQGHQAIFQNQQFQAFPGSVVSPAINLQQMQQQQQQAGGTPKSPAANVLPQAALQQAQLQQGLQLQTQHGTSAQQGAGQQGAGQQAATPTHSTAGATPAKPSAPASRPGAQMMSGAQQTGAAPHQHHVMTGAAAAQKAVQLPRQGAPVVIGQIGVISNQAANNPGLINQQKSPIIAQANQAQVIGSPTQIRFQNQGAFVNNQIIHPVMSVNQFQQMGMPQNISLAQPIFASQGGNGQQLYLRPTSLTQPQQTVQVQVVASKPKDPAAVQVKGAGKALAQQIPGLGVLATPGARLQTLQMTPGATVRVGPPLAQQVTPRVRTPTIKAKTTSPRVIQPKPSVATVQASISQSPTQVVQPKVQNKVAPVTRVVSSTTSPRITPTETRTGVSSGATSTHATPTAAAQPPLVSQVTSPEKPEVTSIPQVVSGEPTKPTTVVTTVSSTTVLQLKSEQKREPLAGVSVPAPLSSVLEPLPRPPPLHEKKQAIVKPVLTHVIEGFVIQEASEPFPIQRPHMLESQLQSKPEADSEKPAALLPPVPGEEIKLTCEYCGKTAAAKKFKNSKRFCSKHCAKRFSVGCSKRIGAHQSNKEPRLDKVRKRPRTEHSGSKHWKRQEDGGRVTTGPLQRDVNMQPVTLGLGNSSQSEDDDRRMHTGQETSEGETESQTASTTTESSMGAADDSPSEPRSPPELERQVAAPAAGGAATPAYTCKPCTQWNVHDVAAFIQSLPGCDVYVEEFTRQEIDGQALSLLKEDHLMSAMNIKLGPALKICASIKQFQEEG